MKGLSCNSGLLCKYSTEEAINILAEHGYQAIDISLEIAPPKSTFSCATLYPRRNNAACPALDLYPFRRYTRKANASHSLRTSRYFSGSEDQRILTAISNGRNVAVIPTLTSFEFHDLTSFRLEVNALNAPSLVGLRASQ